MDFWPSELRGRGSVARGDSTVASDIDVLVDLNPIEETRCSCRISEDHMPELPDRD